MAKVLSVANLLFGMTLVVNQVVAAVLKEIFTLYVSRKTSLACNDESSSSYTEKKLQCFVRSPRLRPLSSCKLSLLQSPVFHLPSSSSPQHRSHGIWTLSFNPQNTQKYNFFGCLLFSARNELFTNLFALNTIFVASHKSQKWKKQHKWLHLWKCHVWGVVFSLFSLGGQAQGEGEYIWQNIKWLYTCF